MASAIDHDLDPRGLPASCPPIPEVIPGHPGIIVTRGHLPHFAAYCWLAEKHTLVVRHDLPALGIVSALAAVLGVDVVT